MRLAHTKYAKKFASRVLYNVPSMRVKSEAYFLFKEPVLERRALTHGVQTTADRKETIQIRCCKNVKITL